jgi:hypothetical protein
METELHEPAGDCEWVLCREPLHAGSPAPYQMSFLSPIGGAGADPDRDTQEDGPNNLDCTPRARRRRCRSLKPADVNRVSRDESARALLRRPSGEFIAPLYARNLVIASSRDVLSQSDTYEPADP